MVMIALIIRQLNNATCSWGIKRALVHANNAEYVFFTVLHNYRLNGKLADGPEIEDLLTTALA